MILPNRRDLCLYANRHTAGSSSTPWVLGGTNEQTEIVVHRRGIQVKRRCTNCGTATGALPMQAVWEWIGDLGKPVVRHSDFMEPYPPCSYKDCVEPGADMHHFAPRNTFGEDADNWPVMPLCQPHHQEWHRRMTGYSWHARAAS